jgi:signal peptidase I
MPSSEQRASSLEDNTLFAEDRDTQSAEWEQLLDGSPNNISSGTVRVAIREMLETAVYILLVFVIVRSLVQNFKIEGSSMEPSLHSGQYILVNKLVYFHFDLNAPLRLLPGYDDVSPNVVYPFNMPERGDVVVFEYPRDPQKDFIKRVIGVPGDTVLIEDGKVYVNDTMLDESYLEDEAYTACTATAACSSGPVVVPADAIFVLGDNRTNSSDSREWNMLSLDRVIGEAWLLYYPLDDWGVLPDQSYAADEE